MDYTERKEEQKKSKRRAKEIEVKVHSTKFKRDREKRKKKKGEKRAGREKKKKEETRLKKRALLYIKKHRVLSSCICHLGSGSLYRILDKDRENTKRRKESSTLHKEKSCSLIFYLSHSP